MAAGDGWLAVLRRGVGALAGAGRVRLMKVHTGRAASLSHLAFPGHSVARPPRQCANLEALPGPQSSKVLTQLGPQDN